MSRPAGFHHTEETKRKMSERQRGKLNPMFGVSLYGELGPNWQGGRIHKGDYIMVLRLDHPYHNGLGYVYEHRLVLEEKLGRYLLPSEVSHHLNGIRDDNRLENLVLYANNSLHMQGHPIRRHKKNEKKAAQDK